MRKAQQGIALLTVLLVMSLALLITAGMLRSHRLALHSSAQQIHQLQLRQLSIAGETWGRQRLRDMLVDPKAVVAAGQGWATGTPALDSENARIEVQIEDLAGRFDMTALLGKAPVDEVIAQRWLRLQTLLEVTPVPASTRQYPPGAEPERYQPIASGTRRRRPVVDAHATLARVVGQRRAAEHQHRICHPAGDP